jgi:hypothetical protein
MFLSCASRPDITYAVNQLTKFLSDYGFSYWKAAKHLLRYLQGTRTYGLYSETSMIHFLYSAGLQATPTRLPPSPTLIGHNLKTENQFLDTLSRWPE